jgi:hypothetical protein
VVVHRLLSAALKLQSNPGLSLTQVATEFKLFSPDLTGTLCHTITVCVCCWVLEKREPSLDERSVGWGPQGHCDHLYEVYAAGRSCRWGVAAGFGGCDLDPCAHSLTQVRYIDKILVACCCL